MAKVFRIVAAVFAGVLVALILLIAIEMFGEIVHPVPADFDGTMEEMFEHVTRCPHWLLAVSVPAWGITALVSTWIAGRIGGRGPAILIGLLLVVGVVYNVSKLPYPIWFKVASLIVVPAAVGLGIWLPLRRKTSEDNEVTSEDNAVTSDGNEVT